MKTLSILLPSLYPILLDRMLRSIRTNPMLENWDREIVIISPNPIGGDDIVYVPEKEKAGTNPALRAAFKASKGEVICCLPDDMIVSPTCFETGLKTLDGKDEKIVCMDGGAFSCFRYRYAICPMCTRATVLNHWNFFFPYTSHWGDPAFSLDVGRRGGKVVPMAPPGVHWGLDRMGQGENSIKQSSFNEDMDKFLRDFTDLSKGWDLSNWVIYNNASCQNIIN